MDVTTDKLMQDLKAVVVDAEDLLKATANQGGEQITRIRARAEESLSSARTRMKEITQAAESQVEEHPWAAVGIAAGIGLIAGILLTRK